MIRFNRGMSDAAIALELFTRLETHRKSIGYSQVELAKRIGVTDKTYRSLKTGSVSVDIFLLVLRELNLLENLEALVPAAQDSPIEILKKSKATRKSKLDTAKKPDIRTALANRKPMKIRTKGSGK